MVPRAEPWLEAAGQRLIGEKRIEVDRRFGHADAVALRRDGRVQVSQGLGVIEPPAFRHEAIDELEDAVCAVNEGREGFMGIDAGLLATLVEPGLRPRGVLGRREIEKGQEVARLVMRVRFLEVGLALGIDEGGRGVGEAACRIRGGFVTLRFNEDCPTRAQKPEGVVEATGDGHQFGGHS